MECRACTIYFSAFLGRMAGLYRFFFFSGSVVAGTVLLKWWGSGLAFFLFLYFAVGSPGGRLFVVGFFSSISVFLGYIWHYMRFRML